MVKLFFPHSKSGIGYQPHWFVGKLLALQLHSGRGCKPAVGGFTMKAADLMAGFPPYAHILRLDDWYERCAETAQADLSVLRVSRCRFDPWPDYLAIYAVVAAVMFKCLESQIANALWRVVQAAEL